MNLCHLCIISHWALASYQHWPWYSQCLIINKQHSSSNIQYGLRPGSQRQIFRLLFVVWCRKQLNDVWIFLRSFVPPRLSYSEHGIGRKQILLFMSESCHSLCHEVNMDTLPYRVNSHNPQHLCLGLCCPSQPKGGQAGISPGHWIPATKFRV